MKDYKKVQARVRAVRGFHEWDGIHERIAQEVVLVASRMAARIFACYCCVAVALQPLVCPKAWQSIVPICVTMPPNSCIKLLRRGWTSGPRTQAAPLVLALAVGPQHSDERCFSRQGREGLGPNGIKLVSYEQSLTRPGVRSARCTGTIRGATSMPNVSPRGQLVAHQQSRLQSCVNCHPGRPKPG